MGLSSSQGRLLMLTSRMSDIGLQMTMISHRQNQLALDSQEAAQAYSEATSNYKLQIKVTDMSSEKGYEKQDVNYSNLSQMGYLVGNLKGQLYLKKDDDGNWIIPTDIDGNRLLSIDETTGKATVINNSATNQTTSQEEFDILDGSSFLGDSDKLQNLIMNGGLLLYNTSETDPVSADILGSNTQLEWVLDTSDDAAAESTYEYELKQIERKDNQFDMEMQELETENSAISKEYESVKSVISSNIDRTFNLFNG